MYDNLFTPFPLAHGVSAPNRLVMGPMTLNQATDDGHITPWIVEWYRQRAQGGVGAIIGAAVFVAKNGLGWANAVGISDDSYIDGWRECVEAAHAGGALFGPQLFHGGAASHNSLLGHQPISASDWTREGFDPARAMTEEEIEQTIQDFADAARRSIDAGSDFVELHGAHAYLLHQFSRGDVNHRTDKWGELTAFPVAVTQAVRAAIGPNIPLVYRFSVHSDDPAATDNPVTPDSLQEFLRALEGVGVDVWDISCFRESRRGYFGTDIWLPDWVKRFSNKPRLVAGNFLTPDNASDYVAEGHAEGIALARALISDAAWVNKTRQNEADQIRPYEQEYWGSIQNGIDPGAA